MWAKQLIIIPFALATRRKGKTTVFVPFLVAVDEKVECTFKESTVDLGVLVAQIGHKRNHEFGLEGLNHLGGHDGSSHPAACNWGNSVDKDIFLLSFNGESVGEAQLSEFSSGVIGLSKISVDASGVRQKTTSNQPAAEVVITTRPNFCCLKYGQAALVTE